MVIDAFLSVLLVLPDQPEAEEAPLALLEVLELLGGEEAGGLHLPQQFLGDPLFKDQAAEDGLIVAVGRLPRQPLLALLDDQPTGQAVEKVEDEPVPQDFVLDLLDGLSVGLLHLLLLLPEEFLHVLLLLLGLEEEGQEDGRGYLLDFDG